MPGRRVKQDTPGSYGKLVVIIIAVVLLGAGALAFIFWPSSEPKLNDGEKSSISKSDVTTLYEAGEFDEFISKARAYLNENPDDSEIQLLLASTYQIQGELEKSLAELTAVIESEPDNPVAFYHLGMLHQQLGNPTESLDAFERAVELEPDAKLFRSELAKALGRDGQHEAAIAAWQELINALPEDNTEGRATIMAQIALLYAERDDLDAVRSIVEQGLEIDPDNVYLVEIKETTLPESE